MLDDIVRFSCTYLFPGYDIQGMYSIKLTGDAELYIDDEVFGQPPPKNTQKPQQARCGPPVAPGIRPGDAQPSVEFSERHL